MSLVRLYRSLLDVHTFLPKYFFDGQAFAPLHVVFEITAKCNLKCTMCLFDPHSLWNPTQDELTFEEFKGTLEQIPRWALITFSGGEPFLRKDFMDILAYAAKRNPVHIISNISALDESQIPVLIGLGARCVPWKGLVVLAASLHGTEEVHNAIVQSKTAYRRMMKTLRALAEEKSRQNKKFPVVIFQTVVQEKNIECLPEIPGIARAVGTETINLMVEHGIRESYDRLESTRVSLPSLAPQRVCSHIEAFLSNARKLKIQVRLSPWSATVEEMAKSLGGKVDLSRYGCIAPWSQTIISPFGDVVLCPKTRFGNIRAAKLKDIYNGPLYRQLRRELKRGKIFPECEGCCYIRFLGNGKGRSTVAPPNQIPNISTEMQPPIGSKT